MNEFVLSHDLQILDEELDSLCGGGSMSAVRLLELLNLEDPSALEDAFAVMEQCQITLDVSSLPLIVPESGSAERLQREAQYTEIEEIAGDLEENDPLRLFLEELSLTPAAGDIQLYAQRYLSGEHHLAEQIVNLYLSRVLSLALTYTGRGVLLMDLIQEGSLGLWESIPRYAEGSFEAHADWWICQYMAKCVVLTYRNSDIGRQLQKDMEDYRTADQRLLVRLGRNPTAAEIAEELGLTEEDVRILEKMVADAGTVSYVKQPEQEQEDSQDAAQAVEDTAYFQLRQHVEALLSTLPEADAKLLTLRFGLEGGSPKTPEQIGKILGFSPEEVLAREAGALQKLRFTHKPETK